MTVLNRRRALALMGSLIPATAFGAGYPERPVKLVVALAAGGPADTAARVPWLKRGSIGGTRSRAMPNRQLL